MIDELVSRCQNGERDAFYELFRIHGTMIQRISYRMTRNEEFRKEIFQEVVLRVIRGILDFRGGCKFTTWLYRITVNEALRFLEKEKRYAGSAFSDTLMESKDGSAYDIARSVERREMFTQTMDMIMSLSLRHKEVLSLFYFADMSIEEIAQLLRKRRGAIKAMLFKARKALIKKLKSKGLLDTL